MMELIYKQEFYDMKSACTALKIELGLWFLEKVYENALNCERNNIPNPKIKKIETTRLHKITKHCTTSLYRTAYFVCRK
ncbi:MAG: hypothetical protein GIS02_02770 [Methanosarcinales archaeon]|uniref:Uncharacterized protein n=1 Tax=Candidatus Ethanoperedens thermophilum TaxID=2766897 RepID=A0A848DAH0_9EURY|nr:hypothetical protein [Candidatus Ethanoperedens thermophilum]